MEKEEKTEGAFIGLVIIIIILIVGGVYIWHQKNVVQKENQARIEMLNEQDAASLKALEQDLQTIDTNVGVDANTVK